MKTRQKLGSLIILFVLIGYPLYMEYLARYTSPEYHTHLSDGSTLIVGCFGISRITGMHIVWLYLYVIAFVAIVFSICGAFQYLISRYVNRNMNK